MPLQVDKAFEVDAALARLGIDLTEAEYAQLLLACSAGDADWAHAEAVLHRMGRELTTLQVALGRLAGLIPSHVRGARSWVVSRAPQLIVMSQPLLALLVQRVSWSLKSCAAAFCVLLTNTLTTCRSQRWRLQSSCLPPRRPRRRWAPTPAGPPSAAPSTTQVCLLRCCPHCEHRAL